MTAPFPTAPLVLLAGALGLAVGYALGAVREGGTDAMASGGAAARTESGVAYISSLRARVAALERERDDLLAGRGRSGEAAQRDEVASARVPSRRASRDPEGTSSAPAASGPEAADPARAAELLARIGTALSQADGKLLEELAPAIAAQRELLAPELAGLLERADSLYAMEHLAELLGLTADPRSVDPLTRLLARDTSDAVRNAAVRALGQIGDPLGVAPLRAEFERRGGSPMPPSLAATSLGQIGTPEAITALRAEISSGENRMVRTFALRALADRRDPALGSFFLEQATREGVSDRYRSEAIAALGASRDQSSVSSLEQIAFAPEWSRAVQEAAKQAINGIVGEVRYPIR